jgi:Tol biopolymer transport system component
MQGIPVIPKEIVDSLNRYQNVRSAPFRDFNQDGESIYIATRFGDVSQLHRVDQAGGTRHQLTFFEEPIGLISRQPDSNMIAFTMDAGGSENSQIFLLDPKTGKSTMLTDGFSRNGAISWSNEGGKLAYQRTKRNGRSNDVWMMDPQSPNKTRMVLESTDGSW